MTRRASKARRRGAKRPSEPISTVSVAELLAPLELAELERMLGGDEDVRALLGELIVEHGIASAGIRIEVTGGRVRITGAVADRLSALVIEDLAWSIKAVTHCHCALEVGSAEESAWWSLAS